MAEPIAVRLDRASKVYRLFDKKGDRLREALDPFRRSFHRDFWALKGISLDIPKGHTVGLLGVNGSGKSTLLQIIASVIQPTHGRVEVNGRVAALLELGAGFNPEMTGRENVIINGTIMGLAHDEVLERMNRIREFADVGDFFDQPMRTYSSGMFMRVAFATAIHVDPDILIVDEALSVGDAKFQEKCYRRFKAFQDAGKTILFVTHDRSAVPRHCDMAMLLHQGELLDFGAPNRVVDLYAEILAFGRLRRSMAAPASRRPDGVPQDAAIPAEPKAAEAHAPVEATPHEESEGERAGSPLFAIPSDPSAPSDRCPSNPTYNAYEHRFGDQRAKIIDYHIEQGGGLDLGTYQSGSRVGVAFLVNYLETIPSPILGISVKNGKGIVVFSTNTQWMNVQVAPGLAGSVVGYRLSLDLNLAAGDWFIDLAVAASAADACDVRSPLMHIYIQERRSYIGFTYLNTDFSVLEGTGEDSSPAAPAIAS
jgi:ABC-type polysaccharide/polyol phosphate transport system ATPase subunit